jgi:hypothetical protein
MGLELVFIDRIGVRQTLSRPTHSDLFSQPIVCFNRKLTIKLRLAVGLFILICHHADRSPSYQESYWLIAEHFPDQATSLLASP